MKTEITDRVENKQFDMRARAVFIVGLLMIPLGVFKIWIEFEEKTAGLAMWVDVLCFFSVPVFLIGFGYQKMKRRTSQFIEWQSKQINYKLGESEPTSVKVDEISKVEIRLDEIILRLKSQEQVKLNIADFDSYELRKRIKSNFEKIAA